MVTAREGGLTLVQKFLERGTSIEAKYGSGKTIFDFLNGSQPFDNKKEILEFLNNVRLKVR